jgi:DNA mismatch endonuclease (patch repair protein)
LEAELKNRSLLVKPQELLFGKFLVDFLVNDKIVIFADGCYFHGCEIHHKDEFVGLPKRKAIDKSQTSYLEKCGFKVFRFWEHDINKNASKCVDQVVKYIESQPRELAGISN